MSSKRKKCEYELKELQREIKKYKEEAVIKKKEIYKLMAEEVAGFLDVEVVPGGDYELVILNNGPHEKPFFLGGSIAIWEGAGSDRIANESGVIFYLKDKNIFVTKPSWGYDDYWRVGRPFEENDKRLGFFPLVHKSYYRGNMKELFDWHELIGEAMLQKLEDAGNTFAFLRKTDAYKIPRVKRVTTEVYKISNSN